MFTFTFTTRTNHTFSDTISFNALMTSEKPEDGMSGPENIVRQLVDRLGEFGVLDSPEAKSGDYTVEFPSRGDRSE